MKVYLAGASHLNTIINQVYQELDKQKLNDYHIPLLESFQYINNWMVPYIVNKWDFILDSGAFTFMNGMTKQNKNKNKIDWDEYVEKYANFINNYGIKYFFEVDVDSIVGLKEVERLREKLHKLTNKQSIPVWHKTRGIDYFDKMVEEFDYVALGGMVAGGATYKDKIEKLFPYFIKKAHNSKCKIHALGYTSVSGLYKYPFDSVDSTSWIYGNKLGLIYRFDGYKMTIVKKPCGKRLIAKDARLHNFFEWVKFQRYANQNL